jgi:hypothetical protein
VPPDTAQLLELQARLQPLKYRLFERRALYLAQQLQEVCTRIAASRPAVRVESAANAAHHTSRSSSATSSASSGQQALRGQDALDSAFIPSTSTSKGSKAVDMSEAASRQTTPCLSSGADTQQSSPTEPQGPTADLIAPQVVLVMLGRQYAHVLRRLWQDKESALYKGRSVPRTFAPSS